MQTIKLGMLALAAGFMFQGLAPTSAEAAPLVPAAQSLGQSAGSGVAQVHYGYRGHVHRRYWGPRVWGPRVQVYRGYEGCYWMKRRALNTGSRYWWRRYNACRRGW